ncbi:hypothetical protein O3P69_007100 [Scylla paramamosain]|uniref:Uncharacterized protein n=1 Tax=Scylla paramamosain TaxID=85552 RepID=A0AAW0V416_SCYPA
MESFESSSAYTTDVEAFRIICPNTQSSPRGGSGVTNTAERDVAGRAAADRPLCPPMRGASEVRRSERLPGRPKDDCSGVLMLPPCPTLPQVCKDVQGSTHQLTYIQHSHTCVTQRCSTWPVSQFRSWIISFYLPNRNH